jgi:putative ABC transport system permease protein
MTAPKEFPQPPQWAVRLLHWLHPSETMEEVEGDLAELYAYWMAQKGKRKADFRYPWAVLSVLPPFVRKRKQTYFYSSTSFLHIDMLRNYLTIALRNLAKHRTYSMLNIAGLAVGLSTTILILLWINEQISYDRFHAHHEQIYRVLLNVSPSGQQTQTYQLVAPVIATTVKEKIPGVSLATRCSQTEHPLFSYQDKHMAEKGYSVDPDFLKIFSFPLVKGDSRTALSEPNTLLITRQLAQKYFGQDEPVGKLIQLDQHTTYKVSGILADIPANSSLQFDYLRPLIESPGSGSWVDNNASVFLMVDRQADVGKVQAQLKALTHQHLPDWVKDREYFLQKFNDWYLRTDFENGQYAGGGRITYVRLFGVVALFVLLIACINFMNLSTARATGRAKEVGVRKVIGADRKSLIRQFLGESLLLTCLAGALSLGLVILILPHFNEVLQKQIFIEWDNPFYLASFTGILLLTGFLAGIYPAFVLSAFQPIKVIKGLREGITGGATWLRKALIVVQFTASVILIVGTGIIYLQIDFIRNRNLGYQKENLIWFDAKGITNSPRFELAKQQLAEVPGVKAVSIANTHFQGSYGRNYVEWTGKQEVEKAMFAIIHGDHDLLPTLQLKLRGGRNFSPTIASDSTSILINEEAARQMNLTNPIGQTVKVNNVTGFIIGVVKDFHIASVHSPIEPTLIAYRKKGPNLFFVRLDGRSIQNTLHLLEKSYKEIVPGYPFDYHFVDQEYEKMYRSELQIGSLSTWFSILAIFISCLGLFGLASFSVERRTKEISVRKVLGASIMNIFSLISKEFILLVMISLVLGSLTAWYLMNKWLGEFSYHVEVSPWLFALAGLLVLSIALLTVSFQAVKAALINPINSLRSE